ncbi:hypothetical protein N7497_009469 [Penicillium chrysogenum]|nr:hypothetical protein N7497_009469 [Penicillium chrysogenum]
MPLQRPPGLEHLPPPGWTGQPVPQQGNVPSPMGPPGITTPGRGMNPNFPPGMLPYAWKPACDERAPRLPSRPASRHDATSRLYEWSSARFPSYATKSRGYDGTRSRWPGSLWTWQSWPTGPSPSSRHLLEMFGQSNGGDSRGGMVGPGQFR